MMNLFFNYRYFLKQGGLLVLSQEDKLIIHHLRNYLMLLKNVVYGFKILEAAADGELVFIAWNKSSLR